jgi:flagellin
MSDLNSINTNTGAQIALQSLDTTNAALAATQKQVSTGYRVSDATDDGAAFAVAQRVRSDVGGLTSANQQLGNVQGLLSTTVNGLTQASDTVNQLRDTLTKVADQNSTGSEHSQYVAQYATEITQLKTYFSDSTYNGKTLVGNIGGTAGFGSVTIIRNEVGSTYGIATFSGSAFAASLALSTTTTTAAAALLTAGGTFITKLNLIGTQLNSYGNAQNFITNQISFNNDKINSLNTGLGALVDANLAQESANLQSLQIKQQLGVQALSLANQSPQTLLSLFK